MSVAGAAGTGGQQVVFDGTSSRCNFGVMVEGSDAHGVQRSGSVFVGLATVNG